MLPKGHFRMEDKVKIIRLVTEIEAWSGLYVGNPT